MPKLVCKDCQTEYKVVKSGAAVSDMFQDPPEPYKIWSCDAWACPGCGHVVMAGFPSNPLAEHFHEKFEELLAKIKNSAGGWYVENHEAPQQL